MLYTTIRIGPQTYTVPVEGEAEVRRLLWAQLRRPLPWRDAGARGGRGGPRLVRGGRENVSRGTSGKYA